MTNPIPSIFHYVWLSGEPLPAAFQFNLSAAKAIHPDFEFRAWTMDDAAKIDSQFLREAILERKWAFATDIIRLHALDRHGGVYFDLDVKFCKSVRPWLANEAVIGWESDYLLGPHLMMSAPGGAFVTEVLAAYDKRTFQIDTDTLNATPLPTIATWIAQRHGLVLDGAKQFLRNNVLVERANVFTLDVLDDENVCEHQYAGSWLNTTASFSAELMTRYAHTQRPSRRLFDAAARVLPRWARRQVYDILHTRFAYPGAYEAVHYGTADQGTPRKTLRLLNAVQALPNNGPLEVTSKYHLLPRSSRPAPPQATPLSVTWAPSVDLIVPIYNVDRYLDRCLRSIQRQDYPRLRVLLIDDGSTDRSTEIAQRYADELRHFEYFSKPNGGLGSARNYGLDRLAADLVTFVDSDDWIEPDFVSSLVEAIGPNHPMAVTNYDLVTPEGRVQQRFDLAFRHEQDPVKQIMSSGLESSAWNKIYRSSLFDAQTRFGDGWFEDFAVIPALVASSPTIGYVSGHKYHYLQRPDSILAKSRTSLGPTMNIFNSYLALKERRHLFLEDRWDHYYQWAIARHLFISRAYNIHDEPVDSRRQQMVRQFATKLNVTMPDWHETAVIQSWMKEPQRRLEKIARRILVDAYRTGRPKLYSSLQGLRRFGL